MFCGGRLPSISLCVGSYRQLSDLIKMEETVKIESGKCKSDVTLDRGSYNSNLAKIMSNPEGGRMRAHKQQKYTSWIPTAKGQIVYGIYPVFEALKARRRHVYKLYYKPNLLWNDDTTRQKHLECILSLAKADGISTKELRITQLDALCLGQVHNGICIDAEPLHFQPFKSIDSSCRGSFVFFDNVLDTFNIGAIVRSCAFFGIAAVVMPLDAGPKAITPAMSRASAGTVEWLPMYKVPSTERFLMQAKSAGYTVIGTSDEISLGQKNFSNAVPIKDLKSIVNKSKFVLILGNEHNGISADALKHCQYITCIPSFKKSLIVSSLNVSAAAAVLLHYLQL